MKTMQDIYARFADMVEELQQKGGEPDYRKICRKLGVANTISRFRSVN